MSIAALAAMPTTMSAIEAPQRQSSDFFMRNLSVVQPGRRVKYSLGMSNALPTRADVLKLLGGEDRAVHAREIAKALGVGDAKYQGFLRLLDNLVFDGVLQA